MKNQAFARQNQMDQNKKLRVVLRQLTADRLTAEQRLSIEQALGFQHQHYLQSYDSPQELSRAISRDSVHCKCVSSKTLFGGLSDPPMARLIRRIGSRGPESTVYIYLPDQKEE